MKDELGGKIMKKFVGLRAKTNSYLKDNNDEDKKAKSTKKCIIKRKLKCQIIKQFRSSSNREKKNYLRKKKTDVDSLKKIKNNL